MGASCFMENTQQKLWVWDWVCGGYNSCYAETAEEAQRYAEDLGNEGGVALVPANLRQTTDAELAKLDRLWGAYFD